MAVFVTVILGLEINRSILTAFVSSTIGAGGAISGTTAGMLITVFVENYIILMVAI